MRKLRKPLSWLLAVCMLFSLLPGTALAADPDPAPVADTTTYTDWEDLFGVGGSAYLTTKDIGRIWTDKSVSTQDITLPGTNIDGLENNTVKKEADADFLVALSGLGSAATIVDRVSVPIDTVLILDMSPKMGDPDAKAEAMLTATESAIRTLMAANPNNRVAVIGYSDYASVLLPLDHYQNGAQADYFNYDPNTIGTGGKVTAYGINSSTNPVENTFDIDRQSSGTDKYTQSGIYLGAQQLLNADTTVRVGGAQVDRAPQIILLSEGEPKDGDTNITAPPTTNSNNIQKFEPGDVGDRNETRHAQSFAMMMTAAYVKGQVADHYTHEGAFITIGVDPDTADAPNLARLCLNPKGELSSNTHANDFNNYFNDYQTNSSVEIMRYYRGIGNSTATFSDFPASVTSLAYNDAYYEVTDVNNAEAWKEIFDEIANDIATQAPTSPTETPEGAEGTGGESGFITFTDELGPYMKVVGAPTVLYGDHAVKATTSDNGATYTFTGTVEGNEIYGAADLSDLELTVTTGGDTQTLTWKVPASLIPLRTVTAESATNALGETTHTIQQNQEAYPIRLFYSVDRDETVTFDQDDNEYLIAHSKDGTTSFYSNAWDAAAQDDAQYGTTTAVFTPADSNAFYHYTEDTPLYVLVDNVAGGNQKLLTHQEALDHLLQSTVIPERETVVIDGTTYNIVRAREAHKGQGAAFFYEHRYYQAQGTGDEGVLEADLLTDYHLVLNPQALIGHTDGDADGLYIEAGSAKLSRVSDGSADKTGNGTGTAVHYRHPVYNVDDTTVTVHLGNNGLRTEKTPTGTLTVKVNKTTGSSVPSPEPTFTYKLELYNVSPEGTVNGKLDTQKAPVTVKIGDGPETALNSDGTFQLQPGQTATVSGIPAGTAYQLTETAIAGYEDTYQNSYPGYETTPQGRVVYDSTGNIVASVTVSHAYAPSQRSFTLTYNGNAVQGSVTNVPSAQSNITGGTQVTLADGPTHSSVNGVAVAFIDWTDAINKTTTILSANDTAPTTVLSPYTVNADTTLYAAWGYDTDNDGTADVNETKYTVTYNANGGYFDSDTSITVKTEKVPAQPSYKLNTTDFKPTHADHDNKKVAFVGWSLDKKDTIYGLDNGYDPSILTAKVDVSKTDATVYAVWGYDTDGDGTPDVQDESYGITASVDGGNGSITPPTRHVIAGTDAEFTIQPEENYALDTVTIVKKNIDDTTVETKTYRNDGKPGIPGYTNGTLTLSDVQSNYAITVTFASDNDGDGTPDKYDRTLTYDANGGYFGSEGTTEKTETGLNDGDRHILKSTDEYQPTHAEQDNHQVLFIGWMTEDDHETIYSVEDTAPDTVTSVSMDEDKAVWAAWGYDEDGNGEPDVTETQYTVTARVEGEGGSIDPTSKTVNAGEDVEFTIDAKDGYALDTIQVNSKTEYTNDDITAPFKGTWTLENVQEAAEVVVTFGEDENDNGVPDDKEEPEEEQYTVTASSDNEEQGSIDPTEATVDAGDDLPFTIHAEDGCALDYITVNGDVVYSNNDPENAFTGSWTLEDIREDSEVVAYFGADEDEDGVPDEPSYWTIEASAGSGGGIDPEGDVFVPDGGDQRFDFDPDRGYEIDRVRVDGDSERVRSSYTFEEVTENHTIRVTFTETDEGGDDDDDDDDDGGITYLTITATAGEGGSISPDGRVQVAYDRNKSFIIQADEGYELADVLVDGRSVGAVGRYTFEKVHKNHTITAVFTASQKLNGVDRWLNTRDHIAYLSGYPDGTFGPDRNMTRAEVAQMFYALLNDQNVPATVSFSDVPDGAWYADAVETLASLGMFTGYPDGTFHPNSTITRAEFAAAALSFADMAPSARCSFPDVSAQDWFYPYVASAAEYGWIGGYPDGTFRPSGSITRAEVAVIVNHMLGRTPDQSFVDRSLDRLVSFSDLNSSHWAFYPIMEASNSHDHIKAGGSEQWTGINN